jgi:hypothetical protein
LVLRQCQNKISRIKMNLYEVDMYTVSPLDRAKH